MLDANGSKTQSSYYPANTLIKETSTDPDNKKVETFKDLYGNVVMQRVAGSLCTYHVHNGLGLLSTVSRPSSLSTNRSVSYAYDLRGWLTNISTSTFAEDIFYADGPGTAYRNGNISSIRWKDNTSSSKRGYKFSYDAANRLTSRAYGESDAIGSNAGRYSESMSYNASSSFEYQNGNLVK